MVMKKMGIMLVVFTFVVGFIAGSAIAQQQPAQQQPQKSPLDAWKPAFDPSGAKYKMIVSNVSSPAIKGVYAGFAIRDELWKRTKGQIYFEYKPFSMLGGEREVLNQLQMGAIQGMGVSSVASTILGPRFGLVNLPFLVDSFEKLDKFISNKQLFDHYMMSMDHQGIMGLGITGYGSYGWASKTPVKSLEDAKKVKFRIAEAEVNNMIYNAWGIKPVVMPWPDVPMALKQGQIDGLDHTPMVCNITKKFEDAKFFTYVNYAQGLFIWVFNKAWFATLPADLQKTFVDTVKEVCADINKQSKAQEAEEIAKAKAAGVTFITLPEKDLSTMRKLGDSVHAKYAADINENHPSDTYKPANFLKEVQDFLGYKP
ncbi:MAG: C4-dicarboxylate ABC transporter substrate-binding protein [Desulfobacterales bacterium CG07_land_8_20_14_0_80_52_14]|nr:MAG: C4-dicarboxylate ABC transporter substrate-binding protein [Desulfobacterales bacterium CG07_land_8_20_14_0_80_52_14]